jgi:hypothetical protein
LCWILGLVITDPLGHRSPYGAEVLS